MPTPTRIILDTDPGIDDALAFFLALASPEVQLEAVTTVCGNVSVEHTTRNALNLLRLAGRSDIPVARGCERPLINLPVDAAYVHGRNGLGDVELDPPDHQPAAQHAVDLIIERVLSAPGEITLVAIGPLTNLALALRREPRLSQLVREVVIMGGALCVPGNVTPGAEFNIYVDPHAAQIVFHGGWPIRLISLDVTERVRVSRERFDSLGASPVGAFIKQIMDFYFDDFAPAYGVQDFAMHDPLCMGAVVQPDLVTMAPVYVDVELAGPLTQGMTVAYFQPEAGTPAPNLSVSVDVDAERFLKLFFGRIS